MRKNPKSGIRNPKLSEEEVKHVAELAGLSLTPEELKKFQKQLSDILNYVEVLSELKTDKVEPTSQVTGLEDVFREDKTGECLTQKEALSGAKEKYQRRFKVKAVFE